MSQKPTPWNEKALILAKAVVRHGKYDEGDGNGDDSLHFDSSSAYILLALARELITEAEKK